MSSGRKQYPFNLIEPKWQQFWEEQQSFRAFNPGEVLPGEHPFAKRHGLEGKKVSAADLPPKFYVLDMFPYPSGAGLHVGHPEGYTATDILARYKRAAGMHVLHPMGWDAFGLPAEQYAIKTGQHPRATTEANIANFTKQIKSLGFSYDWSREVDTTDPKYFRWTQWIFLKLYNSWFNPETNKAEPIETLKFPADAKTEAEQRAYRDSKRLAFVSHSPVWWCEQLGTVLANEEVVDGKSEVGGFPVERKPMRQWMLRITAFAEKLLEDLKTIDWSDSLKEMQRNWIGRSEGAEVEFGVADPKTNEPISNLAIKVFTTRPDTLFGATYMVIAPEHVFLDGVMQHGQWPTDTNPLWKGEGENWAKTRTRHGFRPDELSRLPPLAAVETYRAWVSGKSELERTQLAKEKTGVFTGLFAVNPLNQARIPIFMADYVLASYGTGAIMAVPAHDQRDLEFALKFKLKVSPVVSPTGKWLHDNFHPPRELLPKEYSKKGDVEEYPGVRKALAQIWATRFSRQSEVIERLLSLWATWAEKKPDFNSATETLVREAYANTWWMFSEDKIHCTAFAELGTAINSANAEISLNGLPTTEAKKKITAWLEAKGLGKKTINYKLRDWLFSRQRYWGEPFPIVWKRDANGNAYHEALPESALPLLPPALDDYKPTPDGQPPLARAQDWVNLPDGSVRETNTMPQWAGSCWYYLRYLDAGNDGAFVSGEAERYWMGADSCKLKVEGCMLEAAAAEPSTFNLQPSTTPGVDLYVGGTEHAVLHLLYARFWHKVLFDLGYVSTPEPFFKLVNQGLILGEDMQKMSKSRGNVVNPDDILVEYGADAFRLYEMFMGPLEMVKPWNTKGVEGVYRFLGRVWRMFVDEASETEFEQAMTMAGAESREKLLDHTIGTLRPALEVEAQRRRDLLELIKLDSTIQKTDPTKEQLKVLHTCIKKVTEDLDGLRFNTAISAMMVFANDAMSWETKPVSVLREFLMLLQPFAPHIAEELWSKLHSQFALEPTALGYAPWPKFNPELLVEDTLEIPVQVNGKLRDVIRVSATAAQSEIEAEALRSEKVQQFMAGKTVKKIIVVPKKLVNVVAV